MALYRPLIINAGAVQRLPTADTLAGGAGILFNGDTAAANALDDYEEGTWTPGIAFGGGTTGITYSAQVGNYTKIGNIVICTGALILTSNGSSSGAATITGLPFTSEATAGFSAAGLFTDLATGISGGTQAVLQNNTTSMNLFEGVTGNSVAMTDADITDDFTASFNITYRVT